MGKSFARSLDEARFTFFSPDLPKGDVIRYQQQLAACSPVRLLDLSALNKARRGQLVVAAHCRVVELKCRCWCSLLVLLQLSPGCSAPDAVVTGRSQRSAPPYSQVLPLPALPAAAKQVPAFVGGGTTDIVVDWPAVQETAAWFGVQPAQWQDMAHDCMLDTRWEEAAASLRRWLDDL